LKHYGIVGKLGELIESYLSDRYQRVIIKSVYSSNQVSQWELVKYGVPQGSVLGQLLFLLYINDLPQLVKENVKPVLFADDTSFILSNSDPHLMISDVKEVLGKIQNWFNLYRMLLYYKKTKAMQCFLNTNHQRFDSIEHNSNKVNVVNSIKCLGIIIDSSLTWREHTDYINSKLNSLGYMVRSLRPVLGLKIIMQIYFSYVHSV
jgi:hypothetical protein